MDTLEIGDYVYITESENKTAGTIVNIIGNKVSIKWEDGTVTLLHQNCVTKYEINRTETE